MRAGARVPGAGDGAGAFGLPGAIERVKTGAPVGCKTEDAPLIKAGRLPGRRASFSFWIYITFWKNHAEKMGNFYVNCECFNTKVLDFERQIVYD